MSNASLLIELNAFRAAEGKAPYADFRVARHMPMLIEYRAIATRDAKPRASIVDAPVARVHAFMRENVGIRRRDAMNALIAQGVAFYTARTQIQRFYAANKNAA